MVYKVDFKKLMSNRYEMVIELSDSVMRFGGSYTVDTFSKEIRFIIDVIYIKDKAYMIKVLINKKKSKEQISSLNYTYRFLEHDILIMDDIEFKRIP